MAVMDKPAFAAIVDQVKNPSRCLSDAAVAQGRRGMIDGAEVHLCPVFFIPSGFFSTAGKTQHEFLGTSHTSGADRFCCPLPMPPRWKNAKARYLGKTGQITEQMKGLGKLNPDERKLQGAIINGAKEQIEAALNDRRNALADALMQTRLNAEAIDVHAAGTWAWQGRHTSGDAHLGTYRANFWIDRIRYCRWSRDRKRLDKFHRIKQPGKSSSTFDAGHFFTLMARMRRINLFCYARTPARCRCDTRARTRRRSG